jgi:hypothetical protein
MERSSILIYNGKEGYHHSHYKEEYWCMFFIFKSMNTLNATNEEAGLLKRRRKGKCSRTTQKQQGLEFQKKASDAPTR